MKFYKSNDEYYKIASSRTDQQILRREIVPSVIFAAALTAFFYLRHDADVYISAFFIINFVIVFSLGLCFGFAERKFTRKMLEKTKL
jgi:hypothetical protein